MLPQITRPTAVGRKIKKLNQTLAAHPRRDALLFAVFTLVWMGLIFWQSAKPAVESQAESDFLVDILIYFHLDRVADPDFLSFLVRKAAHMTEYFILGILMSKTWQAVFRAYPRFFEGRHHRSHPSGAYVFWASFLFSVFYAVTDELHQVFVPGRAGRLSDVCIDSAGVLLGCLLMRDWFRDNTPH